MTSAEYRRRLDYAFHVAEWSAANPFRSIATARLESAGSAALSPIGDVRHRRRPPVGTTCD